jgi:N utilization substance protein A
LAGGYSGCKANLASRISDLKKNLWLKNMVKELARSPALKLPGLEKRNLILDEEGNELILPKSEQIPQDYFKKGESIRAVVKKVDMKNNTPVIILSRTSLISCQAVGN